MFYEITQMYGENHETVFNVKVYARLGQHEVIQVDRHFGSTTFEDGVAIARLLIDRRLVKDGAYD
jgi:hypothetical protein